MVVHCAGALVPPPEPAIPILAPASDPPSPSPLVLGASLAAGGALVVLGGMLWCCRRRWRQWPISSSCATAPQLDGILPTLACIPKGVRWEIGCGSCSPRTLSIVMLLLFMELLVTSASVSHSI
jgi:hypothetical protein